MSGVWRVFWVPRDGCAVRGDQTLVGDWSDLEEREEKWSIGPGDPVILDPDCKVDGRLTRYVTRSTFSRLAQETKRNYVNDYCLFFDFLWIRGKGWYEATSDDLFDFEDWRRRSPRNPQRIGAAKWNRELAALTRLYRWAVGAGHIEVSPVTMGEVTTRHGSRISVPSARAKGVRSTNVKWLTPRAFRLWRDVGLRGYSANGTRDPKWAGRNDDRNAAFADVLFSTGMRRTEAGSLLTIELPVLTEAPRRYYDGRLAAAATKSKRDRTFYVSTDALRAVDTYSRTSRRAAIRRAQELRRYEEIEGMILVTGRSGFRGSVLHCRDHRGRSMHRSLSSLGHHERALLFFEGPAGLEPLWLWLSESGTPFAPHSWEAVYQAGSARSRAILADSLAEPPFMTPHMARHSFALYMLVALHHTMDRRFGLSAEERRDFRQLYGDPWNMVRDLLGHASVQTTQDIYLAPVSDLQVRSLLIDEDISGTTDLLARIAAASERVLDSEGTL